MLTVVVQHSAKSAAAPCWRSAAALRRAPAALHGLDPQLPFVLIDLGRYSEQDLLRLLADPHARLAALVLQHLPRRDPAAIAAALQRWAETLRAVEAGADGQEAMEALSSYVLSVTDLAAEPLDRLVAQILQQPQASYVMSTANRLRAEGKLEGKLEGKAEAFEAALTEARNRLLRQLQARFGDLPAELGQRLRRAGTDELDRWSLRFAQATSLADVFAGG